MIPFDSDTSIYSCGHFEFCGHTTREYSNELVLSSYYLKWVSRPFAEQQHRLAQYFFGFFHRISLWHSSGDLVAQVLVLYLITIQLI